MKRPQTNKYGAMPCDEVGEILGMSPEMVRMVEKQALEKLRDILSNPNNWPCRNLRVPALLARRLRFEDVATITRIEDDEAVVFVHEEEVC